MHQHEINRLICQIKSYIESDCVLTQNDQGRAGIKLSEFETELNGTYQRRLLQEV